MICHNFHFPLITIIQDFLTSRIFRVFVGQQASPTFSIPAGWPQGSCLSPDLYNLYSANRHLNRKANSNFIIFIIANYGQQHVWFKIRLPGLLVVLDKITKIYNKLWFTNLCLRTDFTTHLMTINLNIRLSFASRQSHKSIVSILHSHCLYSHKTFVWAFDW